MKEQDFYSDEHISAYIDGELDSEERARLLFDEQQDAELAQRISDSRALKEKIQLAYSDVVPQSNTKKTFNCTEFVSKQRSLVAGISILIIAAALLLPAFMESHDTVIARQLIKDTRAINPDNISTVIGSSKRVIINLSQYQPESFDATINNIEALLAQHRGDKFFNIEIVANKEGLKALDTESSAHAERISLLTSHFENFDVVACAKSMADLARSGNPIRLMRDIMVAPSAAEQVAKRMGDGWMFLKL
ncbi:MAG TPA: hypothetical protein ENJ87_04390 [Gammaproteobacteria bacterium]|nr:hypothetical protein [Gammaproteobacteria bacterium]